MRFLLLLLILLLPTSAWAQQANERVLASKLTHVKVYRASAGLTETASLTLPAGTHQLVFSGLPDQTDNQSVGVTATGGGIILSVTPRTSYLNRTVKPRRLVVLEDSLQQLQEAVQALKDREAVLVKEEETWNNNSKLSGGEDQALNPAAVAQLTQLMTARLNEIRTALRQIRATLRLAEERRRNYQREAATLRSQQDRPTREVVVAYQTQTGGQVSFTLTYVTNGAVWSPRYAMRVARVGQPIQLEQKADVVNTTGKDWSDVRLSLSTGNPAQGGTPPESQPIYLDFYQPRPAMAMRSRGALAEMAAAQKSADEAPAEDDFGGDDLDGAEPEEAASGADITTLAETALTQEFDIAIPYDIPADGQPRQVDIRRLSVPATYSYYTAPRAEAAAFLRAGLTGWDSLGLLPGPAALYLEGSFVAETQINPGTGDTLQIGLGRDPRVAITRERTRQNTQRQFIGSQTRETRGFRITVRNTKREAVTLLVEDHLPVSRNSAIEVRPLDLGGAQVDATTGKLRWLLTLNPGETKTLGFSFEVRWPKDRQLEGW